MKMGEDIQIYNKYPVITGNVLSTRKGIAVFVMYLYNP